MNVLIRIFFSLALALFSLSYNSAAALTAPELQQKIQDKTLKIEKKKRRIRKLRKKLRSSSLEKKKLFRKKIRRIRKRMRKEKKQIKAWESELSSLKRKTKTTTITPSSSPKPNDNMAKAKTQNTQTQKDLDSTLNGLESECDKIEKEIDNIEILARSHSSKVHDSIYSYTVDLSNTHHTEYRTVLKNAWRPSETAAEFDTERQILVGKLDALLERYRNVEKQMRALTGEHGMKCIMALDVSIEYVKTDSLNW